ncbi:MAG: peptidoglycan-associated lipoprotein Pal [Vicinamibacteraceae bacterium]
MSQSRARLLTLSLCLAMALAACGKKPPPPPPAPPPPPPVEAAPPPPPPPPPAPTPAPETRVPTEDEIFARMSLEELNAKKPLGDVFFELDHSDLADEARASLQKNADYLKRWTSLKISVEGHCDERGTAEYNLALGERRATAVRAYLTSLGIGADRVTVVSKGKEQPFCNERADSCYSQNRRGHFLITAK